MGFKILNRIRESNTTRAFADVADNAINQYLIEENDGLSRYAIKNNNLTGKRGLLSILRAALNGDIFDVCKLTFDQIVNMISKDPLSYEQFLDAMSEYVDIKIIQIVKEENLRYVGGEAVLKVIEDERKVNIDVDLFFLNYENKWIKKSMHGITRLNNFTEDALDGELTQIQNEGYRKYPILSPETSMEVG